MVIMKHLKRINELNGRDCSFEDFKDIMLSILDDYKFDYEFKDYSDEMGSPYYDCYIDLDGISGYSNPDDIPYMNVNFLDYNVDSILPVDSGYENKVTDLMMTQCVEAIDANISDIEKMQRDLNQILKFQHDCKRLFEDFKQLDPRFSQFDNHEFTAIVFNKGELNVFFEMREKD